MVSGNTSKNNNNTVNSYHLTPATKTTTTTINCVVWWRSTLTLRTVQGRSCVRTVCALDKYVAGICSRKYNTKAYHMILLLLELGRKNYDPFYGLNIENTRNRCPIQTCSNSFPQACLASTANLLISIILPSRRFNIVYLVAVAQILTRSVAAKLTSRYYRDY